MNWREVVRLSVTLGLVTCLVGGVVMAVPTGAIAVPAQRPDQTIHLSVPESSWLVSQTPQFPPASANRLQQDLSQKVGIPPGQLRVVETTSRTWPNGCLGLARPDEMCTQVMVEGWRVVLTDGKGRWVYRSDRQGRNFRLEPSGK